MWDAATLNTIKDASSAAAIIAFQTYNVWKHNQTVAKVEATNKRVDVDYSDLRADLDAARSSLERMTVTINGGDRRRPASTLSPAEADAARAGGFGNRWTDPREPRPSTAPQA